MDGVDNFVMRERSDPFFIHSETSDG